MRTFAVILEFCGGARTDYLNDCLRSWNPRREIAVLDNASVNNRCTCITHQSHENTYIGGGILRCLELASLHNCDTLFLVVNDIQPATPIVIDDFEREMKSDLTLVQIGAAITSDSTPQAGLYPWMIAQPRRSLRRVPHSDLLCCILNVPFIRAFGDFPQSRGGWGYDLEIAYQGLIKHRSIAIADWCTVKHEDTNVNASVPGGYFISQQDKYAEMRAVYRHRYPKSEFDIGNILHEYWKRGAFKQFQAPVGRGEDNNSTYKL
jgi:hypothetical protein